MAMTIENAFEAELAKLPAGAQQNIRESMERGESLSFAMFKAGWDAHLTQPAQAVDVVGDLRALAAQWRERESRDSKASGEYYSGRSHGYEACADAIEDLLTRALAGEKADGRPVGCKDANSCARHRACVYAGCRHAGTDIAPAIDAATPPTDGEE